MHFGNQKLIKIKGAFLANDIFGYLANTDFGKVKLA